MNPSPVTVKVLEVIARDNSVICNQTIRQKNSLIQIDGDVLKMNNYLGTMDEAKRMVENVLKKEYSGLIVAGEHPVKDILGLWNYKLREKALDPNLLKLHGKYSRRVQR